jgi:hypothetical protein
MKLNRTAEQIRRDGLAALRQRLGVVGMVRFLQQFEKGSGDYTKQRQKWVEKTPMKEIRALLKTQRIAKRRKAG